MPAEWEPHAATWLAWPHFEGDWPGKFEPIPWVFAEIIRALVPHERVELIVRNAGAERQIRKILDRAAALSPNLRFHRWRTDRIWLRDSGCIFVQCGAGTPSREVAGGGVERAKDAGASGFGGFAALSFRFNAWAKYSNFRYDSNVGSLISSTAGVPNIRPSHGKKPIVLEGGSIDVNGRGTLLTTEECLLSKVQQRNPGMTRRDYEAAFARYFGAPNVIWLGSGIIGDDTHGHVDDLARFVAPNTMVAMVEPNRRDPNYKTLADNLKRLEEAHDEEGKPFNIAEIPLPQPVTFERRRLPASYANFYIANGVVLVPVFNRPNDRIALNTITELFPDRDIVHIYSGDFIWGLGAMHCMTQQQPKMLSPKKSGLK